jgi:protein TonB
MSGHTLTAREIQELLGRMPAPAFRERLHAELKGALAGSAATRTPLPVTRLIPRWIGAPLAGTAATLLLFLLMHSLIAEEWARADGASYARVVSFLDVDQESDAQTKKRFMPEKLDQAKPPPPPPMLTASAARPTSELDTAIYIPEWSVETSGIGFDISDMDEVPLVRIEPRYPPRAETLGIEGWVLLEFTISAAGTVVDPVVIACEPPRIFNSAAKRALSRWKYKPRLIDGLPVVREGVQVLLTFEIGDDLD